MLTRISEKYLKGGGKRKQRFAIYRCSCGVEKEVNCYCVESGRFFSCGCARNQKSSERAKRGTFRKPPGEATFNEVYYRYKYQAQSADRAWELSEHDFRRITSQSCHYCGSPPSQVHKRKRSNGVYTYNGIDRRDNAVGYTVENCLPCCGTCNGMKSNRSYSNFLTQVSTVAKHRGLI